MLGFPEMLGSLSALVFPGAPRERGVFVKHTFASPPACSIRIKNSRIHKEIWKGTSWKVIRTILKIVYQNPKSSLILTEIRQSRITDDLQKVGITEQLIGDSTLNLIRNGGI